MESVELDDVDTELVAVLGVDGAAQLGGSSEDPQMSRYRAARGIRAGMVSTMVVGDRRVGTLMTANPPERSSFHRSDFLLFCRLADETAQAFENGRLQHSLTQLVEVQNDLMHRAFHDPLTALPNRALFCDRLQSTLFRQERTHRSTGVVYVELDCVGAINDERGHGAGDLLLVEIAARLGSLMRRSDTAARLGGATFAVVLADLRDEDEGRSVAERIRAVLDEPVAFSDYELQPRGHVGCVVHAGSGTTTVGELMRAAATALDSAKAENTGIAVFHPEMAVTVAAVELSTQLRRALDQGELELDYQPIVDIETGEILGSEALARWTHPTRGRLTASEFYPVAEDAGLGGSLGAEILRMALRQLSEWHRRFHRDPALAMSINISASHLAQPTFARDVLDLLAGADVQPDCIILEFTENTLLQDLTGAIAKLDVLQRAGVHLAIDDVGTGHSTLTYLRRLPVDLLKIGRPFVDGLGRGGSAGNLAREIVEQGSALRMGIIGEGVETAAQVTALRALGCRMAQGYHLARPQTRAAMADMLAQGGIDPAVFVEPALKA